MSNDTPDAGALRERIGAVVAEAMGRHGRAVFEAGEDALPLTEHAADAVGRIVADAVDRILAALEQRPAEPGDRMSGVTIHVLRHTCATNLVRAEVRESVIAELLGDTVTTVVRTYVHLTPADVARGVQKGPRYA